MAQKTEIKLKGHLDKKWESWFDCMTISYHKNYTVMVGEIKDNAFMHGLLNKIRDLNLELISVNPIEK